MRYFFGKYNRNRKLIWFVVGIIIAIIALIHIINFKIKQQDINVNSNNEKIINQEFYETDYSVVSKEKLNNYTSDIVEKTIKQFISFCNDGNIEGAYNMLSQDCKDVLYPTIEEFTDNYYRPNFKERKTYNLQSWITYNNRFVYRVELIEDMLITGKTSNIKKQDYYTVVRGNNDTYYLNISGFIEKNIINSYKQTEELEINVKDEEVFMEYINLNITVTNKSNNNILLDSGRDGDSTFVTDSQGLEYISYLYEKNNYDLVIPAQRTNDFEIKFMKSYKTNRPIETVNFEDIILDYEKDYSSRCNIVIEL